MIISYLLTALESASVAINLLLSLNWSPLLQLFNLKTDTESSEQIISGVLQDAHELRDYWALSELNLELIFPQDNEADFQGEISFPSPLMAIETEMGVVIFEVIGMNKLLSVGTRQLTPLDTLNR